MGIYSQQAGADEPRLAERSGPWGDAGAGGSSSEVTGQPAASSHPFARDPADNGNPPAVAPRPELERVVTATTTTFAPFPAHNAHYPAHGVAPTYPLHRPPPMHVAMPVQAFAPAPPVFAWAPHAHHPSSRAPPGPPRGPWSDRCCEDEDCCCCCCRGCFEPATSCCRCPPWYIVAAYVLICLSAVINWGALAPFFDMFFSLRLDSAAADAAGDGLPWASAERFWNAEEHYRVAGAWFDGEHLGAWTELETDSRRRRERGEEERPVVSGSFSEQWERVDDIDCREIQLFYSDPPVDRRRRRALQRRRARALLDDAPWWEDVGDWGEGYPGTEGCEATCEGDAITREQCDAGGRFFCEWDDGKCWSAVGPEPCPSSEEEMERMEREWEEEHESARDMGWTGFWPEAHVARRVATECETIRAELKSAGGAEMTIRALTLPLLLCAVVLGGVLVGRCNPECRQNACQGRRLDAIGRSLAYLMCAVAFVEMVCFSHYANTFPDMDVENPRQSHLFALALPWLIAQHDESFALVGEQDDFDVERAGFGVSVFVWCLHLFALGFLGVAACTRSETVGGRRGRWYRPERENDEMPPEVTDPGMMSGYYVASHPPSAPIMMNRVYG